MRHDKAGRAGGPARARQARQALLFLKKKKQKNVYLLGVVTPAVPNPATSKSFLLLFFKKEALALPS
jgi:hypothetical protein